MANCESCLAARRKDGLGPAQKVVLPRGITPQGSFRKPSAPTIVCPHCDGETLINSALRTYAKRSAK